MVQTVAAEGADYPLAVRILPRRPWGRDHLLDIQAGQAATYLIAIDAVAVADQITRRRLDPSTLAYDLDWEYTSIALGWWFADWINAAPDSDPAQMPPGPQFGQDFQPPNYRMVPRSVQGA
jgi:hypothetical protein